MGGTPCWEEAVLLEVKLLIPLKIENPAPAIEAIAGAAAINGAMQYPLSIITFYHYVLLTPLGQSAFP